MHKLCMRVRHAQFWSGQDCCFPECLYRDEYVVHALDPDTRVNGARVDQQFLRTGSRLRVGRWTLAYSRDEYADHGRPHGGRIGGELGRQQPQPPRRRPQDDDAGESP